MQKPALVELAVGGASLSRRTRKAVIGPNSEDDRRWCCYSGAWMLDASPRWIDSGAPRSTPWALPFASRGPVDSGVVEEEEAGCVRSETLDRRHRRGVRSSPWSSSVHGGGGAHRGPVVRTAVRFSLVSARGPWRWRKRHVWGVRGDGREARQTMRSGWILSTVKDDT